jgi:hypothetical protein
MEDTESTPAWWCSAGLRIRHPTLDPLAVSQTLEAVPTIAKMADESKVQHGECKSAGYWCTEYRVESPDRPDALFAWAERFVSERESHFHLMLENGYGVAVYIGIHTNVLALGFNIPKTPTLWRLAIPIGIEFFSP